MRPVPHKNLSHTMLGAKENVIVVAGGGGGGCQYVSEGLAKMLRELSQ